MKKKAVLLIVSVFTLLLVLLGLYKLVNSTEFQITGEIHSHIHTDRKVVALTFDDGPNEHADEILKMLADKNTTATFFLIGDEIENNKEEAKKINDAGHQIGNHSYSHQRMIFKSPQFIATEIEHTNALIREIGYQGEITFRPPYGKKFMFLPLYLRQKNIPTIMWDIDPLQSISPTSSAQEIAHVVVTNTKPGSIILIHPWYSEKNNSRAAVPEIIDTLRSEGYEFVTVNDLLAE